MLCLDIDHIFGLKKQSSNQKKTIQMLYTVKKMIPAMLCCLCLFGYSACDKDDDSTNTNTVEELENKLKAEVDANNLTSIAYAVVKNDKLLYSSALGYADESINKLATDSTRYLIASVSKTITAVALMQLVEQNLINLDDDINASLPFPIRNPNFPNEKITFRMLLTHTSSISDDNIEAYDLDCYGTDCATTLEQFFASMFLSTGQYYSDNNFSSYSPGTNEDYSNVASALVGYLVERITQTPFDVYCKTHIFTPLGMKKTEWRLSNTPLSELAVPNSAEITSANPHYTFPDYPNGGLRTTVLDLSRFLRAIIQNGTFNGVPLLSASSIAQMETLQFNSTEQCLSLYYDTIGNRRVLGHSGGEKGVTTEMYYDPNTGVGVIVFCNDEDANLSKVLPLLFEFGEKQ